MFNDFKQTIQFLINHGAIKSKVFCGNCGKLCELNSTTMFWQCRREKKVTVNKRAKLERCNFKLSVRTNTWFHNSSLSFEKVCSIITQYLLLNPPHAHYLQNEFKISPNTYNDWASYIREICEYWVFKNCSEKIGGRRQIVEIDEAKFGHRKYNRGRVIEGKWIFGGIERESNLFFMEPVMDRSKKTLLEVIKRRIKPGTTIISDYWRAYDCLNDEGNYQFSILSIFSGFFGTKIY